MMKKLAAALASTILVGSLALVAHAQSPTVENCGYLAQKACPQAIPPVGPGQTPTQATFTDEPGQDEPADLIHCQIGLAPIEAVNGACRLARNISWSRTDAKITQAEDMVTLGIVPTANLNCPLFAACLIEPRPGRPLPAGRYLYVLRTRDGVASTPLIMRRFDRGDNLVKPCNGYRAFDTPDNYTTASAPGSTASYRYVRHPQLNGGYDDVYAAGEMLIYPDNVLLAVSNESGHFRPADSTTDYVRQTLVAMGFRISPNYRSGRTTGPEVPCASIPIDPSFKLNFENHTSDHFWFSYTRNNNGPYGPLWRYLDGSAIPVTEIAPRYWHTNFVEAHLPRSAYPPAHDPNVEEQPFGGADAFIALGSRPSSYRDIWPGLYVHVPPVYLSGAEGIRVTIYDGGGHHFCLTGGRIGTAPAVTVHAFRAPDRSGFPNDNLPVPVLCLQSISVR